MQRKHKLSLSSYAALIFYHFSHTRRTINQPFKLYWLSNRIEYTNRCLASHCDKAPAVKFKKKTQRGTIKDKKSLIEVSGISAGAEQKPRNAPLLHGRLIFSIKAVQRARINTESSVMQWPTSSPSHTPKANKYCRYGRKSPQRSTHATNRGINQQRSKLRSIDLLKSFQELQ